MQLSRNSSHKLSMHEFSNTGETCWIFSCNINVWCPAHNEDEAGSSVCINFAIHKGGKSFAQSFKSEHTLQFQNIWFYFYCVYKFTDTLSFLCVAISNSGIKIQTALQMVYSMTQYTHYATTFFGFSMSWALWNMHECNFIYANKKTMAFPCAIFYETRKCSTALFSDLCTEFHSTRTLNEVVTRTPLSKVRLSLRHSHGTRLLNKSLWKLSSLNFFQIRRNI